MEFVGFTLRNIGRTRRRSALIIAGAALTGAVMIVWGSLGAGFTSTLHRAATALEIGEIQIHHPAYYDSRSVYDTIPDAWVADFSTTKMAASGRLFTQALAASGDRSAGVAIRGLTAAAEAKVTELHRHVIEGTWLESGAPRDAVVGRGLAKALGVSIGDEMVLVGPATDGSLATAVVRVRGILGSINRNLDSRGVYVNEPFFRDTFVASSGYHEIALRRLDTQVSLEAAASAIAARIAPTGDVKTWRELKPALARMLDILSVTVYFTLSFNYLALGGLVLNVMLMTVCDRMREYGVMKAVGLTPGGVMVMIVGESLWLALFSAIGALVLGLPAALLLEKFGIDFHFAIDRMAFAGVIVDPILHAHVTMKTVLSPILFLLVMMPLASVLPALTAARVEPVDALARH